MVDRFLDLDKYYTPRDVACRAFEKVSLPSPPVVCADTACGSGELLRAAQSVLATAHCVGLDRDRAAISRLRREKPDWQLHVGDLLKRQKPPAIGFAGAECSADLLVLNPPFSMGLKKYVEIEYEGESLRCSVAMAHLLRSEALFQPSLGIIAVVPESLLHSEIDGAARGLLEARYSFKELLNLNIYTFHGARVNSSFIHFGPFRNRAATPRKGAPKATTSLHVVRGSLPVFKLIPSRNGALFVHSTDLASIAANGPETLSRRTACVAKGRASGWLNFLPRVGVPQKENFRTVFAAEELQLSDCVIALRYDNEADARRGEAVIRKSWGAVASAYKGTGARYVTLQRLVATLDSLGIRAHV